MKHIKIKQIKSINEVRECFAFFKHILFDVNQESLGVFSSFHETYQAMLDNIQTKQKLQFVAELDDQIVGCIIASKENTSSLFLPVLAVDDKYRKLGIARKLIEYLIEQNKSKKYKVLKTDTTEEFAGFFLKLGFKPFLYVEPLGGVTIQQIQSTNQSFEEVEVTDNYVKYALPEFKEALAIPFKKKLRQINFNLMMEKTL